LIAGLAAAVLAGFALREAAWRSGAKRELAEEVELGILRKDDLEALAGFGRFRRDWLPQHRERASIVRLARRLVRAKAHQRTNSAERRRLLQVEVLSLRTRLRSLQGHTKQPASASE
jgi:hypothetical protein